MRQWICSLGLVTLSLFATQAKAESSNASGNFYFEETLFPVFKGENDTGSASVGGDNSAKVESSTGYDSRTTLGLILGKSLFVGATYNLYQISTKRDATASRESSDLKTSANEWGPTVGWLGGNWRFLFTYFTSGKKTTEEKNMDTAGATTGDTTLTNSEMSGYQFLIGYTFMVSNRFGIGPSVVYKTVSYSKQSKVNRASSTPGAEDYDDLELSDKSVKNTLDAMLSLVFRF